jgi:hypothetical protein
VRGTAPIASALLESRNLDHHPRSGSVRLERLGKVRKAGAVAAGGLWDDERCAVLQRLTRATERLLDQLGALGVAD